jgi:hypothetical protein
MPHRVRPGIAFHAIAQNQMHIGQAQRPQVGACLLVQPTQTLNA